MAEKPDDKKPTEGQPEGQPEGVRKVVLLTLAGRPLSGHEAKLLRYLAATKDQE